MPEKEFKTLRDRSYVGLRARVRKDERIFAIRRDRAGWYVGTVTKRETKGEQSMDHKTLSKRFLENAIRLENVIHLGTMCVDQFPPSCVADAFEDDWINVARGLGVEPSTTPSDGPDNIAEFVVQQDKFGFLVQCATPVPSFNGDNSWEGMYYLFWVYGEDWDELFNKAVAARDLFHNQVQRNQERSATGICPSCASNEDSEGTE